MINKVKTIKNELISQMNMKVKGNIYHWTQINFAFNSNKIEGSRLSKDQTEQIFETIIIDFLILCYAFLSILHTP